MYVADSVGNTANLRKVETSTKCRIRRTHATTAKHYEEVVSDNLAHPGREDYDVLVISSPTVDITNLDTRIAPNGTTENLEEKVIESSRCIFNTAQEAIATNKNLKKVVIMEHSPRFDDHLKSKLAELANTTTSQLWAISPMNNKIFIGRHSLVSPGAGSTHLNRYKDYKTGMYDGVHLYGRTGVRDYTDSVKSIMMMALSDQHPNIINTGVQRGNSGGADDHTRCEQAMYQWRQTQMKWSQRQSHSAPQYSYGVQYTQHTRGVQQPWSLPTANRFSVFNQGN